MSNTVLASVNMDPVESEVEKHNVHNGSLSQASEVSQTAAEYVRATSASTSHKKRVLIYYFQVYR